MYDEIIILSKHFPFNQGETPAESFLENEIDCIAKKAKKIKVFACDASINSRITCKLPTNVEAYGLRKGNLKVLKMKALLKGFSILFKKNSCILEEFKKLNSIKKKLFLLYFCGKSEIKYSSIIKNIKDVKNENILIYSFWFLDAARASV